MIDHFNEPASRRGGRSLPFAGIEGTRRELGRPLSFAISKERKQIMRATAATAADAKCAQHQPL
jgi:hypothetical protein